MHAGPVMFCPPSRPLCRPQLPPSSVLFSPWKQLHRLVFRSLGLIFHVTAFFPPCIVFTSPADSCGWGHVLSLGKVWPGVVTAFDRWFKSFFMAKLACQYLLVLEATFTRENHGIDSWVVTTTRSPVSAPLHLLALQL